MTLFAIDRAIMLPFFITNLMLWAAVVVYVVWDHNWGVAAKREKGPRHGDPMRLAAAGTAIMMVGFSLRWLFAPQSQVMLQGLYVLSAANAIWIGWLCHAYGRGPRV